MTITKLAAGAAGAVLLLAGSAAFAAHSTGYTCLLTHAPFDSHHVVTTCTGQSADAKSELRAEGCDPATMADAAMRARCKMLTAAPQGAAEAPSAG